MSASPITKNIEVSSYEITAGGKKLGGGYFVLSVQTDHSIHKIARAEVVLQLMYNDADKKTFFQTEDPLLEPGKDIEIKLGYNQKNKKVFKGIIISQGIKTYAGNNFLILKCCDKAVKLTLAKRTEYFKEKKDSELITSILSKAGLDKGIDATTVKHPMMLQQNTTDWEFIKMRAAANGLLLYAESNKVYVKKPGAKASAALTLTYGKDVYSLDAETDATYQLPSATCHAWSMSKQEMLEGKSTEPRLNKQGNLEGKKLAGKVGYAESQYFSSTPMEKPELTAWANSILINARLSRITGRVVFFGNASPEINKQIELKNFGKRIDGKALVTGVRHIMEKGIWKTTVSFGLKANYFEGLTKSTSPSINGIMPAIGGIQIGKIKKIDGDPKKENRLQVELPFMNKAAEGIWARLASFFATADKGAFFIPDVGDEVVVGFVNNDPRHAIILGMLYSSKANPPEKIKAENTIKTIKTKKDLVIEFDDEKVAIKIETPEGNKIVFSDDDSSLKIDDQNGNQVHLTDKGITLKSDGDILLDAGGDIKMKASGDIKGATSSGNVDFKGSNVKLKGSADLLLQSSGKGALKASGVLIVKGSMVKIN